MTSAKVFTLGRSQWIYIAAVLLVIIPALYLLGFIDRVNDVYLHEFVRPRLQQELGFTSGRQTFVSDSETYNVFLLVSVTPGGILHRSGFRSGDIPVGYKHGFETEFLQDLTWSQDGTYRAIQV